MVKITKREIKIKTQNNKKISNAKSIIYHYHPQKSGKMYNMEGIEKIMNDMRAQLHSKGKKGNIQLNLMTENGMFPSKNFSFDGDKINLKASMIIYADELEEQNNTNPFINKDLNEIIEFALVLTLF